MDTQHVETEYTKLSEQVSQACGLFDQALKDYQYYGDKVHEIDLPDKHRASVNRLKQVLGKIRKEEELKENRSYIPRVMKEPDMSGAECETGVECEGSAEVDADRNMQAGVRGQRRGGCGQKYVSWSERAA